MLELQTLQLQREKDRRKLYMPNNMYSSMYFLITIYTQERRKLELKKKSKMGLRRLVKILKLGLDGGGVLNFLKKLEKHHAVLEG